MRHPFTAPRSPLALATLVFAACGGSALPEPGSGTGSTPTDGSKSEMPGMDPGEHLLIRPQSQPERLLGRPVQKQPDGSWLVADERLPGCTVEVRKRADSYHRKFAQDMGDVASLGAGIPFIGRLRGKYGSEIRVRSEVNNTQVLEADLSGECGDLVVRSVQVGTGSRSIEKKKRVEAGADVPAAGGLEGEVASWEAVEGQLDWKEPQAWAFRVGAGPGGSQLSVKVEVPPEIVDCSAYRYSVAANVASWFVIVNDAGGDSVGVLWPHRDGTGTVRHVSVSGASEVSTLDGKAFLLEAAEPAKESLVIFAFTDEAEYRRLAPEPSGALSRAQLAELEKGFEAIPSKRRKRLDYTYNILPQDPPRAGDCR